MQVLKRVRALRIKNLIRYSFLMVVICTLLVFLTVTLTFTSHTILENAIHYGEQTNGMICGEIDSYISYMDNFSTMVAEDADVAQYLFSSLYGEEALHNLEEHSNYSPAYALKPEILYTRITDQFAYVRGERRDIANIGIICDKDNYVLNTGKERMNPNVDPAEVDWIQKTLKSSGGVYLSESHVQNLVEGDYHWVITLSRVVRNPYTHERQGVLFMDLNYEVISDLCEKNAAGERGYVFIVDEDGNIVYHPNQQLFYGDPEMENMEQVLACKEGFFVTDERDRRLYTMSVSRETGWIVVGVSYMEEWLWQRRQISYIFCMTAGILTAVSVWLSDILANKITRPILRLEKSMREVERGNFRNASVEVHEDNEIGSLERSFNIMTEEIQNLMEQNINEQREKRKSELKALQAQINPHFLYNTLESIIWMAESGQNEEVVEMTSSLARMMRQSFNKEEFISLERELWHVKSYLTIQKMRYRDKLNFSVDLEEGLRCRPILKLVVQPLAENAIYHGIRYKEGMGMIRIRAFDDTDAICITIEDNGAGMDEDKLAHIFDTHKVNYNSNGVGVYNVQQRLKLCYGSAYGLTYESALGVGTCVTLRIPKEESVV